MKIKNYRISRLIKRFGVDCVATFGRNNRREIKAFVNDYIDYKGRRSLSHYETTVAALGVVHHGDKIMYTDYDQLWDSDDYVHITIRGEQYEVLYDTVQYIGASPMYVWAILRPVRRVRSADYDDINDEYNEG